MKDSELKVKIKAELGIDEDTAELALKIVNMYCNQQHKRVADESISRECDETHMYYEDKICGCEDCDPQINRRYVCYTGSGKEKQMNFCPTCGRRVRY